MRLLRLLALVATLGFGAGCGGSTPTDSGGGSGPSATAGSWKATSLVQGLTYARYSHSAVWTGSKLIVWGGRWTQGPADAGATFTYGHMRDGAIYDPASDSWSRVTNQGAPDARAYQTAVWTGSKMVVWGGCSSPNDCVGHGRADGGLYDPATDSWTAIGTKGAPAGQQNHVAVWTGSRMIVWGGTVDDASGGIYDPVQDEWTPMSTVGAPSPRQFPAGVWTGSKLIVWGGLDPDPNAFRTYNSGGIYDPASDSWVRTSDANAPVARYKHTAVWTGSRMIVWGGASERDLLNSGGLYDPITDTWSATVTPPRLVLEPRVEHASVWTGARMIVWGGWATRNNPWESYLASGASYDPVAQTWSSLEATGAPPPRHLHTATWTGSRMIVWGGHGASEYQGGGMDTGGVYDPQPAAR